MLQHCVDEKGIRIPKLSLASHKWKFSYKAREQLKTISVCVLQRLAKVMTEHAFPLLLQGIASVSSFPN